MTGGHTTVLEIWHGVTVPRGTAVHLPRRSLARSIFYLTFLRHFCSALPWGFSLVIFRLGFRLVYQIKTSIGGLD